MSTENETSGAAVAEPTPEEQAGAVAEPGKKVKKAKAPKEPKEKKPREPRTDTVHATLWKLYKRNASFETICKEIAEKHPASKFNQNQKVHFNYYKVKYNAERKAAGEDLCTSKGPEREVKPKAEKKAKAPAEAKA